MGERDIQELFGDPDIPDIYVDSVRIAAGAYGLVLELGVQGIADTPVSEPPQVKRLALVRMSPQHALVLAKLLQKNVDIYQEKVGKINLPDELFLQLDIDPE